MDYAPICKCKKNKSYVLFTTYLTLESPIRCGECFGTIPLYRIPYVSGEEHYDIIGWQSNYQSCDMLQMNCSVGEKFGLNQMGKLDSALTKEGLEICRTIKEKTKINTYYYLYRYTERKPNSKENRKCPSCNKTWRLKERLHLFDYKCDRCLLLSNL